MRIAVFGICQAHGFAHALAHMLPEAEVQSFEAAIVRNQGQIATVADLLAGFDVVFTQRFTAGEMEEPVTPLLGCWPKASRTGVPAVMSKPALKASVRPEAVAVST